MKRLLCTLLALCMALTMLLPTVTASAAANWPFVPSDKNMTNGKIKSGWYIIYSWDNGTLRVSSGDVVPTRRAKEVFYFEHLGSNKYYIRDSNGNYLSFDGNSAGKKPKHHAKIVASKTACKWIVYANNAGGYIEYAFALDANHDFDISTGVVRCTDTEDSQLFIFEKAKVTPRSKFTVLSAPDELIPQWYKTYKNGGKAPTDGEVYVVSYPVMTKYKVGEGFDTHGILVKTRIGGKEIDISNKVAFYTSGTVKLHQGRPFTAAGTKVVELRYEEKNIGKFTIDVADAPAASAPSPIPAVAVSSKAVGTATLNTYILRGDPKDAEASDDDNIFNINPTNGYYAQLSPISQFIDSQGQFAFAYDHGDDDDYFYVENAKGNVLTLLKAAPLLGAVTQDAEGYYYAVTGKRNGAINSSNADVSGKYDTSTQTVFISKYTSQGIPVKTTGFDGNLGVSNTQNPFAAGNCSVAINGGVLVCSYARQMYNGHQGKDVIAVKTSDMSKTYDNSTLPLWVSHSFDQRVIWYSKANSWLFADQGDAYPRSFVADLMNKDSLKVTRSTIMGFKGESGDNNTNSQLGGIAETASGAMFIGAAGKGGAQNVKQQLFVSVFDPVTTKAITWNWLTEADVVEPQLVSIGGGRFVVLWEENDKANYMVLDDSGKTLIAKTPLGNVRLNDNEDPVSAGSTVYWMSEVNGVLLRYELSFDALGVAPTPSPAASIIAASNPLAN